MSENINEVQEKENFKKFFKIILGRIVNIENLDRKISHFLQDNFYFYDFNAHYEPPLILSEVEFCALLKDLAVDFDVIEISNSARRFFIDLTRFSPENKKRLIIAFEIKNINGITAFTIENVVAKTYLTH